MWHETDCSSQRANLFERHPQYVQSDYCDRMEADRPADRSGAIVAGILMVIVIGVAVCLILKALGGGGCASAGGRAARAAANARGAQEITSGGMWNSSDTAGVCMIYASWCGHCKESHPAWDEAADRMNGRVAFYKVDGEKVLGSKTLQSLQVAGFPTFVAIRNGAVVDTHSGGRSVDEFCAFAERIEVQ